MIMILRTFVVNNWSLEYKSLMCEDRKKKLLQAVECYDVLVVVEIKFNTKWTFWVYSSTVQAHQTELILRLVDSV